MNHRVTVMNLDDRVLAEEQLEFSAVIVGRDLSSYLLALILHQHGHSTAILSHCQASIMIDLQESIALKYLHEPAKRFSSIEHLSKNGFRIDFNSKVEDFDWRQLADENHQEFRQIKEKIENDVFSKGIPIYEGLIVVIEDDLVRILSEDEQYQHAILRTKYLFIGSDVCHGTIKNHSQSFHHSTVLKTLVDLMTIDRIPTSLAVIGGGIVGSSVASCMKWLGCTRVVLIEEHSHCLNGFNDVDRDMAACLESNMIKQGIEVITRCKINYVNDTACYASTNHVETDYRFIAVGTRRIRNKLVNTPSINIIQLIERISYGRKIQMGTEVSDGKGGTIIQSRIPIIPIDYQRVRGSCSIEEALSIVYRTIHQCFHKQKAIFFMPSYIYTVPRVLIMGQTRVPADDMFICRIYFPSTIKYGSDQSPRGFGKLWICRTRPILCGVQMISEYAEILGKAFGILIRNRISLDELCNRIEIPGSIGEAIQLMIKQAMDQIQRTR